MAKSALRISFKMNFVEMSEVEVADGSGIVTEEHRLLFKRWCYVLLEFIIVKIVAKNNIYRQATPFSPALLLILIQDSRAISGAKTH